MTKPLTSAQADAATALATAYGAPGWYDADDGYIGIPMARLDGTPTGKIQWFKWLPSRVEGWHQTDTTDSAYDATFYPISPLDTGPKGGKTPDSPVDPVDPKVTP